MYDIAKKIELAREFGSLLQEELTSAQFREAIYLNKVEAVLGVCHSHDFCDANMVMLAAFEKIMGKQPSFLDGEEDAAELELWNDAWAIAKAADFFA